MIVKNRDFTLFNTYEQDGGRGKWEKKKEVEWNENYKKYKYEIANYEKNWEIKTWVIELKHSQLKGVTFYSFQCVGVEIWKGRNGGVTQSTQL